MAPPSVAAQISETAGDALRADPVEAAEILVRPGGVLPPELLRPRVDDIDLPRLGVFQLDQSHIVEPALPRIRDLHRDQIVPPVGHLG